MVDGSISEKASRFTLLMQNLNEQMFQYLFIFFLLSIGICACRIAQWRIGNPRIFPTESSLGTFSASILALYHTLVCLHEKYLGGICSTRGTINVCKSYCHVLDEKRLLKIWPVAPSQLFYMPRICHSISRNCLLLLIFKGLLL